MGTYNGWYIGVTPVFWTSRSVAHKYVNKADSITTVVVVEWLKDAVRVYRQKFDDVAVVSIIGADDAGCRGSMKAYDTLKNYFFKNIRFVLYPKISEYGFYFKDFWDIASHELISAAIKTSMDLETCKTQMEDRPLLIRAAKILKKAEKQEYWETIEDDFIPVRKEIVDKLLINNQQTTIIT